MTEHRHLVRIFSALGKEKGWQEKVLQTCGIIVDEQDYLPKVICRKCVNYVNKMWEFRQKCQAAQMTLRQHFSVKRGNITSPCYKPAVKRISVSSESKDYNSKRQLVFGEIHAPGIQYTTEMSIIITNTPASLPMQHVSMQTIQPICPAQEKTPPETVISDSKSVYKSNYHTYVTTPLTSIQQSKVERAAKTKIPTALADVITKDCPSVERAIKRSILHKCKMSCDALCKRNSESSVLYASDVNFNAMKNFSIEKIWLEMKTCHPFLIDLLNAMTGKEEDICNITNEVKVKYCMVYSILMNIRWHELSLFQRINTILLIEGGCGKQVSQLDSNYF